MGSIPRRHLRLLITVCVATALGLLGLAACGGPAAPTATSEPPTAMPTPSPAVPAEGSPEATKSGFHPLSQATCEDLANVMKKVLGVELKTGEASFQDYVSGGEGTGCQATATGTGTDFKDVPSVSSALQKMLEDGGWSQDIQYQADGPTGTAMGFRKDDDLCLLSVNWSPSSDADCPDDQPIAACDLKPEQKLFTIELNCAQAESS